MGTEVAGCRLCASVNLYEVLDLGYQRLSDFLEPGYGPQPRFPLRLALCLGCGLPQLTNNTPPELLYHNRYSFKSGVSEAIGRDLAEVTSFALAGYLALAKEHPHGMPRSWLDIASNDGTLLSNVPASVHRIGIDPLRQFAGEAAQHANQIIVDFFNAGYFDPGGEAYTGAKIDVITAVSMFYDLPDPRTFIRDVAKILAPNGVLVIQQNYLPAMLAAGSVDNISHEHLAYYGLTHMERLLSRVGLEINTVIFPPINGGCFRILASHRGTHRVLPVVGQTLADERGIGLTMTSVFREFAERARRSLRQLARMVRSINAEGGRVYVYGASTRGAVLWQAAGLDAKELPRVVERNPDKIGKVMTSIDAPIISEQEMRDDPPTHLLIGPWWLRDDFIQREHEFLAAGGKMIIPLPKLEVIGS